MTPPQEEIKDFIRRVDKTLDSKKRQLSQLLTKQILEEDKGNKLDKLLRAIQAAELDSFVLNLTDEMVEYLKDLLDRANIVTEVSRIFLRLTERFSFVDEENIEEVVKAFREELENALRGAREKYKGKKIRISLK